MHHASVPHLRHLSGSPVSRYVYTDLFSRVPHRAVNGRKMKMMAVGAAGGPAVVDDERLRSPADAAQVAVARQYPFPAPAEAGPRATAAVVAGLAEPAAVELGVAAGAAQRELFFKVGGHGGEPVSARQCTIDKRQINSRPCEMLIVSRLLRDLEPGSTRTLPHTKVQETGEKPCELFS